LLFRLLERLAAQPEKYLSYEDLLSEVWESNRSDGAVRSVVRRLREALRSQGMDEVAEGIDGSVPGHYALKLSAKESKMQQE
jgi:DNA-binding response OmpR family regulator